MRLWFLGSILLAAGLSQVAAQSKALLEGNVANAITADPLPGARVKVFLPAKQADALYTKADAQGYFRFTNLDADRYLLAVELPGFLRLSEITHGGPPMVDLRSGENRKVGVTLPSPEVKVTPNVEADGSMHVTVTVLLTPYATITGHVTDPNGMPLRDLDVQVYVKRPIRKGPANAPVNMTEVLPDGQSVLSRSTAVRTDDLGEFRAARLAPGSYYVAVSRGGGLGAWLSTYRSTYFPHALNAASAKPLELAAGQEARADIQIAGQSGVRVAGRIVGLAPPESTSGMQPYTNVWLTPQQNQTLSASGPFTTSTADQFEITEVLPGKYTLTAAAYAPSRVPFGGDQKPALGYTGQLDVGERGLDGLTVELQPLAEIAGTVVYEEGCKPAPVRITSQSTGRQVEVTAGPDGKFVVSGLSPGRVWLNVYTQFANAAGWPASVKLGDREVMNTYFDYPLAAAETLRVTMQCGQNRRPQ